MNKNMRFFVVIGLLISVCFIQGMKNTPIQSCNIHEDTEEPELIEIYKKFNEDVAQIYAQIQTAIDNNIITPHNIKILIDSLSRIDDNIIIRLKLRSFMLDKIGITPEQWVILLQDIDNTKTNLIKGLTHLSLQPKTPN